MEKITGNWLWAVVVLPVLVGIFKAEIGKLFTVWNIYRLRAFDKDRDPNTPDQVELLNEATGQWGKVTIQRYIFCVSAARRGVYLLYLDGGKEKVSFLVWASFRKRTPPPK